MWQEKKENLSSYYSLKLMWCHSVMAAVSSPAFLMAHWGVNVEQKKPKTFGVVLS